MTVAAPPNGAPDSFYVILLVFLTLCGFLWIFTSTTDDDAAMISARDGSRQAWRDGMAISGDSLSAVTLMALVGLITLTGYDGLTLSLGCVMGLVLLTLIAEPLRRTDGRSVGDALTVRFAERSVRTAIGIVTLCVCLSYLVLQLTAIGRLTSFVMGFSGTTTTSTVIITVGVLMVFLAVHGGIRGTARVQLVKVVILLIAAFVLAAMVLRRFDWDPSRLMDAAADGSGLGDAFLGPGVQYGPGTNGTANRLGLFATLALGISCLPHVTMRVLATPSARATRTAMGWAVTQLAVISSLLAVIGFGAAAIVGSADVRDADPTGGAALLMVTEALRPGGVLMSIVFCVVFLTALATVADVTIAAAVSVVYDLARRSPRTAGQDGRRTERRAHVAATIVGVTAIALAVLAAGWNLLVLSTIAMTLAASALAPVLVYGLLWPRFTRHGLLWCVYGTAAATAVLLAGSPLISGTPASAFPALDWQWNSLINPGLVTVPLGFALGWLGSVLHRTEANAQRYRELATAALTRHTE
ncbi:cation acetate symporter [Streptomyces gardneri]|uniref:sodium/solute symporter n=1 Tax=Streptomyces gardneri TaxID=66892 RepID=UPI0036BFFFB6